MDSSLSDQKGKDTTSIQSLTKCVYSRGGLTGSLQPDDGHSSASKVTQQMATTPGSSFYLHISRVTQQVATALGSSYYLHMSGEHSFQARLKEPTTVLKEPWPNCVQELRSLAQAMVHFLFSLGLEWYPRLFYCESF